MVLKRVMHVVALGAATVFAGSGLALAQGVPAELPPATFSGDQYVDSRGCIFIRAGVGGNTQWIPRVGRDRQQLCGFQPSLSGRAAAAATPANPAEREGVVIIGGTPSTPSTQPAQQPATTARTTAPTTTTRPAAASTPAIRVITGGATAPRTTTAPAATRPAVTTAPTVTAPAGGGCPGVTGLTARYLTGRCGPQAVHPGDAARGINRPGPSMDQSSMLHLNPPEGYRAAFDDGRLNPQRGPQTLGGDRQMAQIWTDTVPRRLLTPEERAALTVTASTRSRAPLPEDARDTRTTTQAVAEQPVIRIPADHRNVLAGTFSDRSDADAAYARLARSGQPARLGVIQRAGGQVYAVVAGPYADANALARGLQATRAAGFAGATTRR